MRCISRSITLLASLLPVFGGGANCVVVDGARILAADVSAVAPAFAALPPERDLGAAPAGSMIRTFQRSQLAAFFAPGAAVDLPDRLCVERRRDAISPAGWQTAIHGSLSKVCGATPFRVTIREAPQLRFPSGELVFQESGLMIGRGPVQLWRGAVHLPDKSSIPVWVRVQIEAQRDVLVLTRDVGLGETVTASGYKRETVWAEPEPASRVCAEEAGATVDGLVARKAMKAGEVLHRTDLRRLPAVQRGHAVELEARAGSARVRIPAVAEQNADIGERIKVKSDWNGARLVGRVIGHQKARVE